MYSYIWGGVLFMEILDLVAYVNKNLVLGLSTAQIEKNMKVGKDTIRKKLNRAGYKYNKTLNLYEKVDTITYNNSLGYNNATQNNIISYKIKKDEYNPVNNKKTGEIKKMDLKTFKNLPTVEQVALINKYADGALTLKEIEQQYFTFTNISKYVNREEAYWNGEQKKYIIIEPKNNIFTDEEIAFLKMLYSQHQKNKILNEIETDEIITRSVRVDKNVMNLFADYCKKNNLNQTKALSKALLDFIKNN